jgi:hypothetical protein
MTTPRHHHTTPRGAGGPAAFASYFLSEHLSDCTIVLRAVEEAPQQAGKASSDGPAAAVVASAAAAVASARPPTKRIRLFSSATAAPAPPAALPRILEEQRLPGHALVLENASAFFHAQLDPAAENNRAAVQPPRRPRGGLSFFSSALGLGGGGSSVPAASTTTLADGRRRELVLAVKPGQVDAARLVLRFVYEGELPPPAAEEEAQEEEEEEEEEEGDGAPATAQGSLSPSASALSQEEAEEEEQEDDEDEGDADAMAGDGTTPGSEAAAARSARSHDDGDDDGDDDDNEDENDNEDEDTDRPRTAATADDTNTNTPDALLSADERRWLRSLFDAVGRRRRRQERRRRAASRQRLLVHALVLALRWGLAGAAEACRDALKQEYALADIDWGTVVLVLELAREERRRVRGAAAADGKEEEDQQQPPQQQAAINAAADPCHTPSAARRRPAGQPLGGVPYLTPLPPPARATAAAATTTRHPHQTPAAVTAAPSSLSSSPLDDVERLCRQRLRLTFYNLELTAAQPRRRAAFCRLPLEAVCDVLGDKEARACSETTALCLADAWMQARGGGGGNGGNENEQEALLLRRRQARALAGAVCVPKLPPLLLATALPRLPWLVEALGVAGLARAAAMAMLSPADDRDPQQHYRYLQVLHTQLRGAEEVPASWRWQTCRRDVRRSSSLFLDELPAEHAQEQREALLGEATEDESDDEDDEDDTSGGGGGGWANDDDDNDEEEDEAQARTLAAIAAAATDPHRRAELVRAAARADLAALPPSSASAALRLRPASARGAHGPTAALIGSITRSRAGLVEPRPPPDLLRYSGGASLLLDWRPRARDVAAALEAAVAGGAGGTGRKLRSQPIFFAGWWWSLALYFQPHSQGPIPAETAAAARGGARGAASSRGGGSQALSPRRSQPQPASSRGGGGRGRKRQHEAEPEPEAEAAAGGQQWWAARLAIEAAPALALGAPPRAAEDASPPMAAFHGVFASRMRSSEAAVWREVVLPAASFVRGGGHSRGCDTGFRAFFGCRAVFSGREGWDGGRALASFLLEEEEAGAARGGAAPAGRRQQQQRRAALAARADEDGRHLHLRARIWEVR